MRSNQPMKPTAPWRNAFKCVCDGTLPWLISVSLDPPVIAASTIQGFPWPLIPGLIGFAITFIVQFRLKNHLDRDKVLAIQDMAELFTNSVPPQRILTERGQEPSGVFCVPICGNHFTSAAKALLPNCCAYETTGPTPVVISSKLPSLSVLV